MTAEYIAKIRGDTSNLEKVLKQAQGKLQRLNDDEVLIKLNYDGNVKQFNKVFDGILKQCPELTIQFQYDVNKKMLDQEMDKLQSMKKIEAELDLGNAKDKIYEMVMQIKKGFSDGTIEEKEMIAQLQHLYKYINTAKEFGVEVDAGQIAKVFSDIDDRYDGLASKLSKEPLTLFDVDKTLEQQEAVVKELQDQLKQLEELGASPRGGASSAALEPLQKQVDELTDKIDNMQAQLNGLSGEKFDEMTAQVNELKNALDETLERISRLSGGGQVQSSLKDIAETLTEAGRLKNNKDMFSKTLSAEYWQDLAKNYDSLDESIKRTYKDLGLFNSEVGGLKPLSGGANNFGGLLGDNSVAIVRRTSAETNIENTNRLKDALDEAYKSGVNCTRILDVIKDESGEVFVELQTTMSGKGLSSAGNESTGWLDVINPEVFKATDDQVKKLYSDMKKLWDMGIEVEPANFENILFDEKGGFSLIDLNMLDTNPRAFESFDEMFADFVERLRTHASDMRESLDDAGASGLDSFTNKLEQAATSFVETAEESTKKAQDSNSPSKVAEELGKMWGQGYVKGILEHKDEVEKAVKELVKAGQLTMKDLIEDQQNIYANPEYADLVTPVKNILSSATLSKSSEDNANAANTEAQAHRDNKEAIEAETSAKEKLDDTNGRFIKMHGEVGDKHYSYVEHKGFAQTDTVRVDNGKETHALDTKYKQLETEIKKVTLQIVDAKAEMDAMSKDGINTDAAQENIKALGSKLHDLNKELDDYYNSPKHVAGSGNRNALSDDLKKAIEFRKNELAQVSAIQDKKLDTAIAKEQTKQAETTKKFETSQQQLSLRLDDVANSIKNSSDLTTKFSQRVDELRQQLTDVSDTNGLQYIDLQVKKLTEDVKASTEAIAENNRQSQKVTDKAATNMAKAEPGQQALYDDWTKLEDSITNDFYLITKFGKRLLEIKDLIKSIDSPDALKYVRQAFKEFEAEVKAETDAIDTNTQKQLKAIQKQQDDITYQTNDDVISRVNALYDQQVKNLNEINALKVKNLSLDSETNVGKAETEKNLRTISELEKENYKIELSIIDAEAVQGTREGELIDLQRKLNQEYREAANIKDLQSRDDMSSQASKWLDQIEKLQTAGRYTKEFQDRLEDARIALMSFDSAVGSIDEVNESFEKLEATMKDINSSKGLSEFKRAQESSIAKLNLQIEEFMTKNSRMGADFQKRFANLKINWDTEQSLEEVQKLVAEFVKLKQEVTAAGKTGANFFDTLRQRAMGVNAQLIAQYLSWQDMIRYGRQAFNAIRELDYALVDLKKTTTMTTSELNDFYYSANDTAKQMGVTTKEIIDQAAAWSRLGYSSKESATEMAALSSQFAQISPGMDIDTATDGLVSTMKAFHIDVADVEREVMDVINKTGNTMATNNQEIVEMLKRSSAAMSAANNSLEETIALESAAVQITRNAETTGTAFRTISMRIRGYDEETEEYIGGIEELTGKIADLTKTASNPQGISLFTDETKTTYKSTYQILKDISDIYNDLSDANQAALLETLAGKRGGQVLAGILADFSEVERAMGNMKKAAGSADAEMAIVEESIDYKINKLEQTWIGIVQELIDNGMLGKLIDALTAISEVLGDIITTIGPLPSILAGLGIRELLLNIDRLPNVLKAIEGGLNAGGILSAMFGADVDGLLEKASQAGDTASEAFGSSFLDGIGKIFQESEEILESPIKDILDDTSEDVLDSSFLENIGQIFTDTEGVVDNISEMSEETQGVIDNISNLKDVFGETEGVAEDTAEAVEAIGTSGVGGASKLAGAFKALVPILTNPITIIAGIAVATYALYKWVDGANDRQREKIQELKKEFNELDSQLEATNSELANVEKQIEDIQSKGTLSLVEQQELERLRTQAELLKLARQEQEELLKLKAQELVGENKKHFDKVYGDINETDITNPEERLRGYDYMVGDQAKFSYGENLSNALKSASEGEYNDNPNELLAIYQQVQEAREGALKTIKEYENANRELNEEEQAALEGAKIVIEDTDNYMSGLQIQIGKVKTELLTMRQDAARAGTTESEDLLSDVNNALKLVYQYSGTAKEWNAMQIDSVFDSSKIEKSRQELEALASSGELTEETLKQYPELQKEIERLDLILEDGQTTFGLFKKELIASAEAAKNVDNALSSALDAAKGWDAERNEALKKLGMLKETSDGIEYDDTWTNYLETIKQLNPELAKNETELEKCALANIQFSKAVDDLSKNFKTYKEALKDVDTITPEYSDTIKALADDLSYLTGIDFTIEDASVFLKDANNLTLLEEAINGSDEALTKLQANASQSIRIKVDEKSVKELQQLTNTALVDVKKELEELGKGGNVDLTIRPKIDTHFLSDVGWEEAAGEYATVFTQTFANEAGDVALNFTPIIVDENGNFVDVMEPDALTEYAEGVIAGTRTDDLKLQIGGEFTGEHAIEEAEAAAMRIHNLHEIQIELGLDTSEFNTEFNNFVDWLETADLGTLEAQTYLNEDPFINGLINLAKESKEMADKIKKIFDDLGWDIQWETTKMKVPKAGGQQITSIYAPSDVRSKYSNAGSGAVRWEYEEMDVPTNIHFERKTGTGTKRSTSSAYTPKSLSPSQKSAAKQNIDKANSSGKDKEDDYKEFIDYFERLVKTLDNSIDLLEAHLEDVVGSFAKNSLLDAEEDNIKKKMSGYASAVDMYAAKASEALSKIPSDIAAKIQNGAVAIDEFVGEGNKEVVEAIQEYEKWADKVQDCKLQLVELKEALRQLELKKFNNLVQDFQELFDVRQTQIDLIGKTIDLFETASDKIVGRGFYDVQLDQTTKQLNKLYEERTALINQANKAMANGIDVASDEWFEMLNAINDVDGAIIDAQKSVEEYKNSIVQLYVDAFDRESNRYTKQIELRQKSISALEKQISIIEAAGNKVGISYFEEQIEQTRKQITMLQNERNTLMKKMSEATSNGVKVASDEWYSMVDALEEVDSAIQDCVESIENFDNAILALHTATFERIQNRFSSLSSELSNMGEMFDYDDVATEENKWTKEGLARLGLLTQQYELAKRQVAQYNEEIAELNAQYTAGKYSVTEYTDKLAELKSAQWSAVQNAKSAKDNIVSLNKERVDIVVKGIEKEISEYQKLINAQKDLLSSEKELHDYEKSIGESAKAVSDLERQLNALAGDTSLAAAAKRAKLEEELREKREALQEQEYAHSIEMQQEALDQQAEDYEEYRQQEIDTLQESLNNEEQLIAESFERVKENTALIGGEILTMAQQLNITMSEELTQPWFSGENAIASYSALFNTESSSFINRLGEVENSEWRLQEQANQSSQAIASMFSNKADELVYQTDRANEVTRREEEQAWNASRAIADAFGQRADGLVSTIENARGSTENLTAMSNALGESLKTSIDGSYSGASAKNALDSIADAANGVADAAANAAAELSKLANADIPVTESQPNVTTIYGGPNAGKVAVWDPKNPTKYTFRAKGSKSIPHDELAWTQENGPEMIVSPTDGAILTPLKKGDMVLPAERTSNIWEWGNFNPTEFANKLIQNVSGIGTGNVQTNTMQVGSLVTVNGNINDSAEMMQIAAQQASVKIKQSFKQLSNGLNG